MTLSYEQKNEIHKSFKKIRNIKKFEIINRLFCYACVLPFLHTATCIGQKKEIPLVDKVGTVGFVFSTATAFSLKNREEKLRKKIKKIIYSESERV